MKHKTTTRKAVAPGDAASWMARLEHPTRGDGAALARSVKPSSQDALNATDLPDSSAEEILKTRLCCKTSIAAFTILRQLMMIEDALSPSPSENRISDAMKTAMAMLDELEPRTGTEALLAAQMVATQRLAMTFLYRASLDGQAFEGVNANVARARGLMRLFNEQVETMAKLKGKSGQQRVIVEHVTVAAGGQAIVGTVVPGTMARTGGHDVE